MKAGGIFITEQVGAENDRELVELLLGKTELPFPEQYLDIVSRQFCGAGFEILDAQHILEQYSCVEGKIHRFLLVLRKQK